MKSIFVNEYFMNKDRIRGYIAVKVEHHEPALFSNKVKQNEEELSKASSSRTREEDEEEETYF